MLDVSINHVGFSYGNEVILGDIDMHVDAGDFVCLLGPSGCGKSTLLRLLAGLETPDSGEILVENAPVRKPGLDRAVVFQDYGLFPWMTTGENITAGLKQKYKDRTAKEHREIALKWMNNVGLDEAVYDKLPGALSGGMKQRCAIARAFAIDSPILLMDEPFGSLDAVTKAMLQDLVLRLWDNEKTERKTIFFVTHEVDEALLLATDIVVLGQTPSSILHRHIFGPGEKPHRTTMYGDAKIMALRNKLIKLIHTEIDEKAHGTEAQTEEIHKEAV